MSNPTNWYYFAGLGFTAFYLDIPGPGNINQGSLSNQSFTQPCSDISYDSATGQISFAVAESPELVRDILFTGNVISDGTGSDAGFSGTWKGDRVIVIRNEGTALPVQPPPSLTVEGYWAAVLNPKGQ
jgi:hypothetical protein